MNVGPCVSPYTHTGVLNYCKELGVPIQLFVNETDASYFYYEGASAGSLANKRVRMREVKADMIGHTNELLVKAIDQNQLDLPITPDDKKKLVSYLINEGYLDSSSKTYKAFANRGPGDPYDMVALLRSGYPSRMRSIPASWTARRRCRSFNRSAGFSGISSLKGFPARHRRQDHAERRGAVGASGRQGRQDR